MKKTIRMNERELHRMISESVKKVLREFDEYDEFDQNSDVGEDMDTWRLLGKLERGEVSDEQLVSMVRRHGAGDFENLYDILKGDNRYPKFEKEMQNAFSWEEFGGQYEKDANPSRGYGDTWFYGLGEYADAEHENGNRLENPLDVIRKSGEKPFSERRYNPALWTDDGEEGKFARAFKGNRASIKNFPLT